MANVRTHRPSRAPQVLSFAQTRAPLRGMRPDLAKLAHQLEDEVNLLWEVSGAQENASRELEVNFTALKLHVSDVAQR